MSALTDMPLATLLAAAESLAVGLQTWLDMSEAERVAPKGDGLLNATQCMSCLTVPLLVSFLREIHSRGIETGWEWLVEEFDAA